MASYRNIRKVLNLPTLSASPGSGVNGEMYFNTDDLALYIYDGEWKKVTQSAIPYKHFLGTDKAFCLGGDAYSGGSLNYNNIDAISFASDGNATDWGDLVAAGPAAGDTGSSPSESTIYLIARNLSGYYYRAEKIATDSASNSVAIGGEYLFNSMVTGGELGAGQSATHAIVHSIGSNAFTTVQALAFASGTSATNNMTGTNDNQYGLCYTCCMLTHIFYCGGRDKNGSYTNAQQIRKYANAGDTNAANHGSAQLTQSHSQGSSGTSNTHGFVTAGFDTGNTDIKQISTFPYASETNSTDHGDLLFTARKNRGGASSSSHGYAAGGSTSSAPYGRNVIEKYSTTSAANSTDVGDLSNSITNNSLGYK